MNFEEARVEYGRLRQAYDSRQISPDEYGRRVQSLQVRDADGTYWAIDGNSGGWLRYDGASWVPGQPPLPHVPGPIGGFSGQDQGGYGQQPQGNFGSPAPGAYPTPAVTPSKRRNRGLLIGCGLLALLLLLCVGGVAVALIAGGGRFAFSTAPGVTEAATAKTVKNSRPDQRATTFAPREPMYITYTINKAKVGDTLELRVFRDGTRILLTGSDHTLVNSGTIYGADTFIPTDTGTYRVEFYYDGEASPSKTLDFTVR